MYPSVRIVLLLVVFFLKSSIAFPLTKNADTGFPTACERTPPVYNISLDADTDPFHRWDHLVQDFPDLNTVAYDIIMQITGHIPVSNWTYVFEFAANVMHKNIPSPFQEEIQGISDRTGVDLGMLTLINLAYDLTAFCTSVVAADKDGIIWHGRNLDYDATRYLRKYTVTINYQKNNMTIYSGVAFAGFLPMLTLVKPNAFSISTNQRDMKSVDGGLGTTVMDNVAEFFNPNTTILLVALRNVLEQANSYAEAVAYFDKIQLPAPIYVIIGGLTGNEGTVLSRDRNATINARPINIEAGKWYVLQTNYDYWLGPDPEWDNRREHGEIAMNNTGRENINRESMYQVLSVPVVNNPLRTVYTTIMSSTHFDQMQTWIRCPLEETTLAFENTPAATTIPPTIPVNTTITQVITTQPTIDTTGSASITSLAAGIYVLLTMFWSFRLSLF